MSNKYAGTKTEKNLETAFAGESMARNKYTFFASKAKKEGFEQIAAIFTETANNEKEHAKLWFKELGGIGETYENLNAAAEGENYEWTDMYETFAKDVLGQYTVENYLDHYYRTVKEKRYNSPISILLIERLPTGHSGQKAGSQDAH